MADMGNIIGGMGGIATAAKIIGILLLWVFIVGSIVAIVIMILVMKKGIRIIEINDNKRILTYKGKYKKKKGTNIKQFWARKIGRFLPQFPERNIHTQKKNDAIILYKDNNGMHHTLRTPTYEELVRWYYVVYNIDITKGETYQPLADLYLLPQPHENLDWLANQVVESDQEFKYASWWQHPNVIMGMSIAGAIFLQMVNFVFIYLMNK